MLQPGEHACLKVIAVLIWCRNITGYPYIRIIWLWIGSVKRKSPEIRIIIHLIEYKEIIWMALYA